MIEHNIILNMKQPGALETGIELTQGDYGQVAFYIRVKDDNTYITNATKATMVFNLSDGAIVSGSATISAGTYSYVFKGNELQTPGKVSAMITLEFSDGRVSSCGYTFEVRYNPLYDRRIPAGVYISELENIVQQAQGQIDYLNQLIQILQGDVGGTVLTRANLVNNFLATIAGVSALDAVAGKTIWDKAVEAHNIANAAKDTADKVNSDINKKLNVSAVQIGIGTSGDDGTVQVTFPTSFAATPIVLCQALGQVKDNISQVKVDNRSKTGFKATVVSVVGTGAVTPAHSGWAFLWLAISI